MSDPTDGKSSTEQAPKIESISPLFTFLQREWRVVKTWAFWVMVVIVSGGAWSLNQWHFSGIIAGKDATSAQKDATIKTIEAERDSYRSKLQDAGIVSTPLKKRALILAEQVNEFADGVPNNADSFNDGWQRFTQRFGNRIKTITDELDSRGQHSDALDHMASFEELANTSNSQAGTNLIRMAKEIKR